jgi:hypothetical protein
LIKPRRGSKMKLIAVQINEITGLGKEKGSDAVRG